MLFKFEFFEDSIIDFFVKFLCPDKFGTQYSDTCRNYKYSRSGSYNENYSDYNNRKSGNCYEYPL